MAAGFVSCGVHFFFGVLILLNHLTEKKAYFNTEQTYMKERAVHDRFLAG